MTLKWVLSETRSQNRAGHVQWYLCDDNGLRIVGEVVQQDPDGADTYYAELMNGKGLRYFTNADDAKRWLWSFYILEKASCN